MASTHQQNIARYHAAMSLNGHHGSHNMYIFHRDWHQQNRDPRPPSRPDRNWGMNLVFGTNFLQMHHEMVKAATTEQHFHMMHESLVVWYQQQGIVLPSWNPMQPIPNELGYDPDPTVFPEEILQAINNWAQQEGLTVGQFLTRTTNNPQFTFPKYFTREGIEPNEVGEPITGARKLADFRNSNQLGCCLIYSHNEWHGTIGGAMGTTWTAIADPIFYWGVHWSVDSVFDEYKSIQAERVIRPFDLPRLSDLHALESEGIDLPEEFNPEQKAWTERQVKLSQRLNR